MIDILYNLKPNEPLFGDAINRQFYSIDQNFKSQEAGTNFKSTKTVDILVGEEPYAIGGDTFDPPITVLPYDAKTIKIEEDGSGTIYELVQNFVKNGDYYDVMIMPSATTAYPNVKITVLW